MKWCAPAFLHSVQQNNHLLGAIGLAGFGVALLIHILAVLGMDVTSQLPYVWSMHFAVLLYYAVSVIYIWAAVGMPLRFDIIRDHLPGWVTLGCGALMAYCILNFVLAARLTGSGNASVVSGEYLLMSHGHILAHLNESEYHLHKAYELRMFSGGWMLFWFLPSAYFLF